MSRDIDSEFKDRVYAIVAQIPAGRLMTYGQIAALCGSPRAARIVGGVAHYGPTDLPWQRVVKKDGSLAEGFPGGIEGHRQALAAEGIETDDELRVDIKSLIYFIK
ncbi:MAG: methylated-DNA--[protein]-cysteine S-methyltransferase [Candidatus Saccharibacteria bacterium]|nr:methylated-DNA--[protein]-cysteine S-methyltransferase [Candidatus Saccharibacteria bacterium]